MDYKVSILQRKYWCINLTENWPIVNGYYSFNYNGFKNCMGFGERWFTGLMSLKLSKEM